jgi:integrase
VARDRVDTYLDRQRELNTAISADSFDKLLTERNDEFVFTTRLGAVANIFNLNRAFNGLLDEMGLKLGADGKTRTLYSLRHYYATQDLKRGMSTHALSKQMGNSTAMLDKHYSKYSPIINAEMHSGRNVQAAVEPAAETAKMGVVELAFVMLAGGKLDAAELLASIGVGRDGYVVTEEIAMKAMAAKGEDLITGDTLLRILNG